MEILTADTEPIERSDLFYRNRKSFYKYIATYAASNGEKNETDSKPLRIHSIGNIIDCIFSPNMPWSFYNAILDTDICRTTKEYHYDDNDGIIRQILSVASQYKCPIYVPIKPTAIDTQKLLRRFGFLELPAQDDAYQYIDFYHYDQTLKAGDVNSAIEIYELDDSTQENCRMRKSEWGHVLCQSFGFPKPEVHGPFYSDVWSRVEVGPTKPIRMFIALKNDRVVGGCHLSLACGVACLFNVTTLKDERGQGIGKALSLAAMIGAKEANYRYMVLQATAMGSPVYKKLGFKSMPSFKLFIKISTAAWYYKIIELALALFGLQRIQRLMSMSRKLWKSALAITILLVMIIGIVLAIMFR